MPDGKSIITGWADGKIRAFGPQTGKLQYTIVDAHSTAGKNVLDWPYIADFVMSSHHDQCQLMHV